MKERAYPVYTVNKHAEGLLVGGHPWVRIIKNLR